MYLLFNTGGTHTRIAISHDGVSLEKLTVVRTPDTAIGGCRLIMETGQELAGSEQIDAVAGGVAGVWDQSKKILIKSPNLPGWKGKINLPNAFLENDAALEALGEAVMGAGRRRRIAAYLCVGTGIGGCRIVEGKIDDRTIGFEPGQMIVSWGKKSGYLEEFASGRAVERIWGKQGELTNRKEIWENEARLLSIALHNISVMWSPEIIVLGGSVIKSVDIGLVKKYLTEEMKIFPEIPEISTAELGDKSGLYGALELIRQKRN